MFLVIALFSFIAVSQIVLGSLLWIDSNRTKRKDQRLFVGVLVFTLIWTFCNAGLAFIDTAASNDNLYFFELLNKAGFFFGVSTLLSIFLFSFYYPITKDIKKYQKILMIFGVFAAVMSLFSIVSGTFLYSDGKVIYKPGQLVFIVGIFALSVIVNIFISDFKFLFGRSTDPKLKRQVLTLFSGIVLMVVHATVFIIVLPELIGQQTAIYVIGYLAPYYLIFLISYSLFRQGLFDIRLVVARTVGYILSIGVLALVYGVLAFSIIDGFIFTDTTSTVVKRATFTMLAVILAISYQPLKKRFDKITNKIFYRDAYDSQELLDDLNKILVSTIDLNKLLKSSAVKINQSIRAEFVMFGIKQIDDSPQRVLGTSEREFTKEDIEAVRSITPKIHEKSIITDMLSEEQSKLGDLLRKNDIAVLMRLTDTPKSNQEGLGYIVLGNKKSGGPYSKQDLQVLEIITDVLVIAIQNALRFEEIKNFNITLQDKVNDATKKLRSANNRLIELDQTKDDFISMASHQLRTPLTSIKGYVSMVMEGDAGKISKKQAELLDQAFVSSQRMVYLIADLLNVSRLRTGKFVIEPKETNLADIIEGEIAQLKETAKGRDLELVYKKPKGFLNLMLDETKIRQVIMNFADNAIYYTPTGGHIKVLLEDKGDSVEFTVTDDGIGVPKAEQHHLFNKFYRAGNAKKARPDGTGLGLFMAKKVVIAQGGSIIFQTQEGKGSTFGFAFVKKPLLPENYKGVL